MKFRRLIAISRHKNDFLVKSKIFFPRRLLLTADPQWPAIKLSAIMEGLSIHISELKLSQLTHCLNKLSIGGGNQSQSSVTPQRSHDNLTIAEGEHHKAAGLSYSESR